MTVPAKKASPRGGVDDIDLLGGHYAALAVGAGVDGALLAHRYDHAGNVGAAHVGGQRGAHLVRRQVAVIVGEHQPGLLLVADKAVDLLQEAAALHGNAHVGDRGVDLFAVLFGVVQNLLDSLLLQIKLDGDAVAVGKDLVALSFNNAVSGVVSGRFEMAAQTSPSLLNTASQVPMPSGMRWM